MNPHEDTTELIPYRFSLNSSQMRRKMNESVWSVESLVPFIPPKEWLLHNGMFEPEVTVEEDEHCRHSNHNDRMVVKARKERRQAIGLSSSGSVPVSDSWLIFSTPAEKQSTPQKPAMESEMDSFEMRVPQQGHTITLSGNNPLESPTYQQSKISVSTPPEEDVDENGSSEPEANLSPNQDLLIVSEQREESPGSPEQEDTLLLNSADGEKISPTGQVIVQNDVDTGTEDGTCGTEDGACGSKEVSQLPIEQLCVPVADPKITEVSPSKRHLVDCGIQCNKLQECTCGELKGCIGPNRKYHFKNPGMKKANHGNAEGLMMNGHVQKNLKRHESPL
uniref:uncharacterized protein LOC109951170 isoform X2 n=1 Tax=Monopterus albus TaxID=43700 RepID=UPI0009B43132|nr:uncharacterized protein LOC109951170 isoform X2 [Monopterus albus]